MPYVTGQSGGGSATASAVPLDETFGAGFMRSNSWPLLELSLTFLAVVLCTRVAHAVPGVLERPAAISAKAPTSVLLAATVAGKRMVVVGERGIILVSDDEGASWRQSTVPVSVTLTGVHFATDRKGWVVGHSGVVLHTEDGGETWSKQLDGNRAAQLVLESAQNDNRKARVDDVRFNKRLVEAQQLVDDGADKPFFDIYFENEQRGYIVGAYNMVFRTEDGGKTWKPWQGHVDNPRGMHLYGMRSAGSELYLVGEQGTVLRSKDGGDNFASLKLPYTGTYFGMISIKNGGILVYGLRGNVYWSGDRGVTWRKIESGVSLSITAGAELADGTILLVGQGGDVLMSRDKGHSFRKVPTKDPSPISGIAQSPNGGLVLVGVRGVTRIPSLDALLPPAKGGGK